MKALNPGCSFRDIILKPTPMNPLGSQLVRADESCLDCKLQLTAYQDTSVHYLVSPLNHDGFISFSFRYLSVRSQHKILDLFSLCSFLSHCHDFSCFFYFVVLVHSHVLFLLNNFPFLGYRRRHSVTRCNLKETG